MNTVGFIGTGIMGAAMAANLIRAGFDLRVYSRTRAKAAELEAMGAAWADSPAACCAGCDAVITMVGFPEDVRQVYFGADGVLAGAGAGACLIDMTTTSPKLSVEIYAAAKEKGLFALDAPVSGGDTGAKAGTLAIMAGGDREAFERCLPLFRAMGKNVVYEGAAGSGQHTKMANQIAIAGAMAGLCEAMTYAERAGLDVEKTIATIRTGAAGSAQMEAYAPKILAGDYAPGFYIRHFIKDMAIAQEENAALGGALEVLDKVLEMYRTLAGQGKDGLGTQALVEFYR